MSLKQCPGCQGMVDESKAYCPDCGTPMEEEQRRSGSSEYDSLMKTQNINVTSHLKMLENFNLSSVFTPPKDTDESDTVKKEPVAVKRQTKTVQLQAIPEMNANAGQPVNIVPEPKRENNLSSNNNAVSNAPNSKKTLYIVGGIVLLFLALAFAAAVTFGILYLYNK